MTLTIPEEDGTLDTARMEAASVADYNEAVEEFRRGIEAQAQQQYSTTPESPCPYGLMPVNGDDGVECVSKGGRPEGTEQQQTITEATDDEVSCDDFLSAAGNPSQFQAQQFFDANDPDEDPDDADGDSFACDDLETGEDTLRKTFAN